MNWIKYILEHFFARSGVYEAAGMFSFAHLVLFITTTILLVSAIHHSFNTKPAQARRYIKIIILILWCLEIFKIGLQFHNGNGMYLNTWVPLYYCSIALFAGLLSVFGKGIIQRIGDIFLTTGGIVGGTLFLLYPSSSLLLYPGYHFLSLHSFFYHGCMVYIGVLLWCTSCIELQWSDMKYYSLYVLFFCLLAWFINRQYNVNLMFISQPFVGTFLENLYILLGKMYTPVLILVQMYLPFIGILLIKTYVLPWMMKHAVLSQFSSHFKA